MAGVRQRAHVVSQHELPLPRLSLRFQQFLNILCSQVLVACLTLKTEPHSKTKQVPNFLLFPPLEKRGLASIDTKVGREEKWTFLKDSNIVCESALSGEVNRKLVLTKTSSTCAGQARSPNNWEAEFVSTWRNQTSPADL